MKKIKITFNCKDIYTIPDTFFKVSTYEYILIDLDNTLEIFKEQIPSQRLINLGKKLNNYGKKTIIISNSIHTKRVQRMADAFGCYKYLNNTHKPCKYKLERFLKENNINSRQCLFIGDQFYTDAKVATKLKMDFLLTRPLGKKEQFFTKFNRIFEKFALKRYEKMGKLGIDVYKIYNE